MITAYRIIANHQKGHLVAAPFFFLNFFERASGIESSYTALFTCCYRERNSGTLYNQNSCCCYQPTKRVRVLYVFTLRSSSRIKSSAFHVQSSYCRFAFGRVKDYPPPPLIFIYLKNISIKFSTWPEQTR